MSFSDVWLGRPDEHVDLLPGCSSDPPLSNDRFRLTDVQGERFVIEGLASETGETWPCPRDKFESPYRHVSDDSERLDHGRLPPSGDLHSVVPSVPRIDVDEEHKKTRSTGFKDRLATAGDEAAESYARR